MTEPQSTALAVTAGAFGLGSGALGLGYDTLAWAFFGAAAGLRFVGPFDTAWKAAASLVSSAGIAAVASPLVAGSALYFAPFLREMVEPQAMRLSLTGIFAFAAPKLVPVLFNVAAAVLRKFGGEQNP